MRHNVVLAAAIGFAGSPRLPAQTIGDLAARDAFVVAPSVVLPSFATEVERPAWYALASASLDAMAGALHPSVALSASLPIRHQGFHNTVLAGTVARIGGPCGGCSAWIAADFEAQTQMTRLLAARLSLGRAFRIGDDGSSTSAALQVPMTRKMTGGVFTFFPGIAIAGLSVEGEHSRALRPILGASVRTDHESISFGFGARIVLQKDGPGSFGIQTVWPR